ncbi:MAG: exodeoxyribonuclease VII small subunit [Myxococcota bacterium]
MPTDERSFEAALAELEARVQRLERGEIALDDALRLFEEGVALVRECHEKLDAADARIVALTGTPDAVVERPGDEP